MENEGQKGSCKNYNPLCKKNNKEKHCLQEAEHRYMPLSRRHRYYLLCAPLY